MSDGRGRGLSAIEKSVNVRSRLLQLPHGDQGLFLRAETFHEIGGYADMPIMEDLEITCRLRGLGRIAVARPAAVTSARRWEALGVVRTTVINQLVIAGFYAGIPLDRLAGFYGTRETRPSPS
jgi:hypothetical protein